MSIKTLFGSPGDKYKRRSENFAAMEYARLNAEFDACLTFNEPMPRDTSKEDAIHDLGNKEERRFFVRIYAKHSVRRIGSTEGSFFVTSYLFNLVPIGLILPQKVLVLPKEKLLPDIDVVEIESINDDSNKGIDEIVSLYKGVFGWTTDDTNHSFPKKFPINIQDKKELMVDPIDLLFYAKNKFGYNLKKDCF